MTDPMYQLLQQMQQTKEGRDEARQAALDRFDRLAGLDDHTLLMMIAWLLERQNAMLASKYELDNVELDLDRLAKPPA